MNPHTHNPHHPHHSQPPPDSQHQPQRNAPSMGCVLTLTKGRHTWRFRCASAEEPRLLSAIAELASDAGAGLDSFDLALLASQLQEHFAASHSLDNHTAHHNPNPAHASALPHSGAQG